MMIRPCLAVGIAAALAGACGFEPLHGRDSGASAANLAKVEVAIIADRTGQKLRNLLLDKLNPKGPPARPDYRLVVHIRESRQTLAIRKDEVATRANLVLHANFTLNQAGDGKRVLANSSVSTVSYDILQSDYATLSAENDARDRAVRELSDDIKGRVAMFLRRRPRGGPPGSP